MSPLTIAPFAIGEEVFVAWARSYNQETIKCPVCDGKRSVTLILGDGEHVPIECEFCQRGCDPPGGYVTRYVAASGVNRAVIEGIALNDGDWKFTIDHHTHKLADADMFTNEAEAEARRVVMHAEAERQAQANFESQFKGSKRKHSWTVGYHRSEIADLKRKLEWHESKLRAKETS